MTSSSSARGSTGTARVIERAVPEDGRRALAGLALSLLIVASALQVGVGAAAAGTTQTSIDSCQTIDDPGTYTITKDLVNYNEQHHPKGKDSCIFITADDVTLEGQNYKISLHETAIMVEGDDVTVQNVVIEPDAGKPQIGIQYYHALRGTITGNEITGVGTGIDLVDDGQHEVSGNTVEESVHTGIHIRGQSNDNEIYNNDVVNRNRDGITLETGSTGNEIRNNDVVDNREIGIEVTTHDNTVVSNTVKESGNSGIVVDTSQGNEISNNDLIENGKHGISLEAATDTTVSNNLAENNDFAGIYLSRADNNEIGSNNELKDNENGIKLYESTGNKIHHNTVAENTANGTYVSDGSHHNGFFHNELTNNAEYGIAVENSDGNQFIDASAVDNDEAAFFSAGGGLTDATSLDVGSSGNPITIAFHNASDVVIDTTTKPPDGPNPNTVGTATDSGSTGVWNPPTVQTPYLNPDVQTALDAAQRDLAEIMNVSEKAQVHKYVRVRPPHETAQGTGVDATLHSLKIYYQDSDLNCNEESELRLWRFTAKDDPQESGAWLPSYGEQQRGTTAGTVDLNRFDSVTVEQSKYVGAVTPADGKAGLVSFKFVDYAVFAVMSDRKSNCTPTAYTPPSTSEGSPGFGFGVSLVALLVTARRLLART